MRIPYRLLALSAILLVAGMLVAAEPLYHVLGKGETIYAVARRYQVSVESILGANGIKDPGKVMAGTKLLIPRTHIVQKGETLFGIARDNGLSVEELRAANNLAAGAVLKAGDSLYLPVASRPGQVAEGQSPASSSPAAPTTTTTIPPSNRVALLPGAQSAATAGKTADPRASWPVAGAARYLDGKLRGVIIAAAAGSPVKAVSSGKVVSAGAYRGYGLVAFVEGRAGHIYVYGGLESLGVQTGDSVSPGGLVGKVGIDRASGLPAAYFFVFKDGAALDPAAAPRG